jgi:hypothetical protein
MHAITRSLPQRERGAAGELILAGGRAPDATPARRDLGGVWDLTASASTTEPARGAATSPRIGR